MHTTKIDNYHKAHPTECDRCGRRLPKKAYKPVCATCQKQAKFREHLFEAFGKAGAERVLLTRREEIA